jgi:hypothetical protein
VDNSLNGVRERRKLFVSKTWLKKSLQSGSNLRCLRLGRVFKRQTAPISPPHFGRWHQPSSAWWIPDFLDVAMRKRYTNTSAITTDSFVATAWSIFVGNR